MSEQNFYPFVTLRGRDFGIIEEVAKINEHDEKVRLKTVNGDLYFCYDVKNPRFIFPFGRIEGEETARVAIPNLPGNLHAISEKWNEFLDLLGVPAADDDQDPDLNTKEEGIVQMIDIPEVD